MMSFTKCANGHIYDPDIYPSCPYCNDNGSHVIDFGSKPAMQSMPERTVGYVDAGGTIPLGGESSQPTLPVSDGAYSSPGPAFSPNQWDNVSVPDESPERDGGTEIIGGNTNGIVPVAGWLVCIKGNMRGSSYTLYCKQNTIGRDVTRDVFIQGDNTISGHQANISYDLRHNKFTIVPRTETNTMYLNDEPIYEAAALKEHDLIEMGRSSFVFIPFCGERYTWDADENE